SRWITSRRAGMPFRAHRAFFLRTDKDASEQWSTFGTDLLESSGAACEKGHPQARDLPHAQLVGGFKWCTAAAADDSAAIAAGQRIGDFHRACRTIEWFWKCFGSHTWNLAQGGREMP